jgi:hypothetical protein
LTRVSDQFGQRYSALDNRIRRAVAVKFSKGFWDQEVSLMSIKSGFAFPRDESNNAPSSGDGGPGFNAPAPSDRMDTTGGLDSHLSRGRGSERDFREAQAASSGVHPDGGGAGLGLPTDVDRFSTVGGRFVDSDTGSGYGIAGGDHLITRKGTLPPGTNEQSAGKAI